MQVEVTKEDILKGVRDDPFLCPIARAVRRKQRKSVGVADNWLEIYLPKDSSISRRIRRRYSIPEKITKWIRQFDAGEKVKPVSFTATPLNG